MVNVYQEGDIVYAKVNPTLELIVRRFIKEIYYCQTKDNLEEKDLVYFERELMPKKAKKEKE